MNKYPDNITSQSRRAMALTKTYDKNLANQSYIHFRKTDSSTFASQFPEFRAWLYKTDSDLNYVNIIGSRSVPVLDDDNNLQLNPEREKNLPKITSGDIYNMYFLDDIKIMYFNGVPYSATDDYITSIKFWDGDSIVQDPSTHVVMIPKITGGGGSSEIDISNLKQSKLSFRDANGLAPVAKAIPFFSTVENTFIIDSVYNAYRLNGVEGSQYALTNDIVGSVSDNLDTTLTLNSLKNYILTHGGGGGGGGGDYDDTWHSDDED